MTNTEFSKQNKEFLAACEAAKTAPTRRQASKWRLGKGIAYKTAKGEKGKMK